jgi:hypothetical protein
LSAEGLFESIRPDFDFAGVLQNFVGSVVYPW